MTFHGTESNTPLPIVADPLISIYIYIYIYIYSVYYLGFRSPSTVTKRTLIT